MKYFFLACYFSFLFSPKLNSENFKLAQIPQIKSCMKYRYKKGINFKLKNNKEFQILSTSKVELLGTNENFIPFAYDEAKAMAKVNLSNFLKLKDLSNIEESLTQDLNIRKNGRLVKKKSQIKNDLEFFNLTFSNGFRGIKEIDECYKKGKYIMATIEVTDKTFKNAKFLENQMK